MGQSAACSYWAGNEEAQIDVKDVQVDMSTSEQTTTQALRRSQGSTKTAFRPPSKMLKDLKTQESKKLAQERWAQTKAEWEANVTAEIEEREKRSAADSPGPGTEPDRYAPDERSKALQAIKEEEEAKQAKADGAAAYDDTQGASFEENTGVLETPQAVPETVAEPSRREAEVADVVQPQQQEQLQPDKENERPSTNENEKLVTNEGEKCAGEAAEMTAAGKATLEDFLAKNGFDGVSNKRKRALRTSIYPLHLAAEKGDAHLISLLRQAGADRVQKDSSGRTPEDAAKRKNKKGSHDDALAALASP